MKQLYKTILHWIKWNIATPICHMLGVIAPTDWMSCYYFMSKKILPYMKQFRKKDKQGIPMSISMNEEIRKEMFDLGYEWDSNSYYFKGNINGIEADDYLTHKWNNVLDEIIFALEYTANNDPTEDCEIDNPLYNPNQKEFFKSIPCEGEYGKKGYTQIKFNEDYGKTKLDMDLLKKKEERVSNGYKLMGIYWQNLWD